MSLEKETELQSGSVTQPPELHCRSQSTALQAWDRLQRRLHLRLSLAEGPRGSERGPWRCVEGTPQWTGRPWSWLLLPREAPGPHHRLLQGRPQRGTLLMVFILGVGLQGDLHFYTVCLFFTVSIQYRYPLKLFYSNLLMAMNLFHTKAQYSVTVYF